MRTYGDGQYIYSVDMMLIYIHLNKVKVKKYLKSVRLERLEGQLRKSVVWHTKRGREYTPHELLLHPEKYRTTHDMDTLKRANLDYPIIVWNNINKEENDDCQLDIVDGFHRTVKAMLHKKVNINAYVFDNALMKKFIIYEGSFDQFIKSKPNMEMYYFIDLYKKRFGRV
jgi:hypothetical protein